MIVMNGKALARLEGLGAGYEEKRVTVSRRGGVSVVALTYYATRIDETLLPYAWYKHHVLAGAREMALPSRK